MLEAYARFRNAWVLGAMAMIAGSSGIAHAAEGGGAGQCPAALDAASRLILVRALGWDAPTAVVELRQRDPVTRAWIIAAEPRAAVIGLKGLAWGFPFRHLARPGEPLKVEGDKRSPAGIYAVGAPFGFAASALPGYQQLVTDKHICVEDVRSPEYGRIVERSRVTPGVKFDQMRAEPLYSSGMFVDYPPDAASKAGSCIFVHIWRKPGQGTAGCVALAQADVMALQEWSSAEPAAIAIVPPDGPARFGGCLP